MSTPGKREKLLAGNGKPEVTLLLSRADGQADTLPMLSDTGPRGITTILFRGNAMMRIVLCRSP